MTAFSPLLQSGKMQQQEQNAVTTVMDYYEAREWQVRQLTQMLGRLRLDRDGNPSNSESDYPFSNALTYSGGHYRWFERGVGAWFDLNYTGLASWPNTDKLFKRLLNDRVGRSDVWDRIRVWRLTALHRIVINYVRGEKESLLLPLLLRCHRYDQHGNLINTYDDLLEQTAVGQMVQQARYGDVEAMIDQQPQVVNEQVDSILRPKLQLTRNTLLIAQQLLQFVSDQQLLSSPVIESRWQLRQELLRELHQRLQRQYGVQLSSLSTGFNAEQLRQYCGDDDNWRFISDLIDKWSQHLAHKRYYPGQLQDARETLLHRLMSSLQGLQHEDAFTWPIGVVEGYNDGNYRSIKAAVATLLDQQVTNGIIRLEEADDIDVDVIMQDWLQQPLLRQALDDATASERLVLAIEALPLVVGRYAARDPLRLQSIADIVLKPQRDSPYYQLAIETQQALLQVIFTSNGTNLLQVSFFKARSLLEDDAINERIDGRQVQAVLAAAAAALQRQR